SGRQGIEQARGAADVVFVDIGLPDMDGCEVARTVRDQPGGAGVYLVALTGHSGPENRDRALRAGFDSYLVKPVAPDAVRGVMPAAPAAPEGNRLYIGNAVRGSFYQLRRFYTVRSCAGGARCRAAECTPASYARNP